MPVAGILLILAAGLIYAQYRSDLSTARRELQAGSQIAHTACGAIEYAVAGSGPAVLVIHGAGGCGAARLGPRAPNLPERAEEAQYLP
jgi:hypothetical protein